MVVPDFFTLERYAEKNNLPVNMDELLKRDDIQAMLSNEIITFLTGKYASYEIPKKFIFLKALQRGKRNPHSDPEIKSVASYFRNTRNRSTLCTDRSGLWQKRIRVMYCHIMNRETLKTDQKILKIARGNAATPYGAVSVWHPGRGRHQKRTQEGQQS